METTRDRIIKRVLRWAQVMIGMQYSKKYRYDWYKEGRADCSGYVFAMWLAGLFPLQGIKGMTSMYEVYAQGFDLMFPASYDLIGKDGHWAPKGFYKTFDWQPGDIIFYCRDNGSKRSNKITHVACCYDKTHIIHTRLASEDAIIAKISYGDDVKNNKALSSIVAVIRLKTDATEFELPDTTRDAASEMVTRILQAWLNYNGAELRCDGDWGPKTANALKEFKAAHRLCSNGEAIDATVWSALIGEKTAQDVNPSVPADPQPTAKLTRNLSHKGYVNASGVSFRNGASVTATRITKLGKGTNVTILGVTGSWTHVRVNGRNGYVYSKYIARDNYMRGEDVKAVQQALGFTGKDCDGVFGAQTAAAVTAYQATHGLTVDGVVGPKTWGKLFE